MQLSAQHLPSRALPRKALDVLELAASAVQRSGGERLTPDDVAGAIATMGEGGVIVRPREEVAAVLAELDRMPGLDGVKRQIRSLVARLEHEKALDVAGVASKEPMGLNFVLLGGAGTGKTTVARLLVRILYALGLLDRGHLVETDRSGLVSEHIGGTAPKTNAVVDSAIGGGLFVDEAYAMMPTGQGHDYAGEAVATLLKRIEDDRGKFACVVAGYTRPMKQWLASNPGLASRFTHYIDFEDYEPAVLLSILETMLTDRSYKLAPEAQFALRAYVGELYATRDEKWGNARAMRNLVDAVVDCQAAQLAGQQTDTETRLLITAATVADAQSKFSAQLASARGMAASI